MAKDVLRYDQGKAALHSRRDWCKGCDICVQACPENILKLDEMDKVYVTNIDQCIFCGICAERCPDFCFTLEREELVGPEVPNT